MDKQILAQMLGKLHFTAALPDAVIDRLASSAILTSYPSGTLIFREGSRFERLLLISIGRVALDIFVPGRGNIRILSLGPGDMVAWSALLRDSRMTTSAIALEDTQAIALSASEILKAQEENHTFGYFLMRQVALSLADRLMATRLQLLDLFSDTSPVIPLQQDAP